MTKPALVFEPKYFRAYVRPLGALPVDMEAHALFYYWMLASKVVNEQFDGVYMEDDAFPEELMARLKRLYKATMLQYGVDGDRMQRYWLAVDNQINLLNIERGLKRDEGGYQVLPAYARNPA